jgi:hypothetical protein
VRRPPTYVCFSKENTGGEGQATVILIEQAAVAVIVNPPESANWKQGPNKGSIGHANLADARKEFTGHQPLYVGEGRRQSLKKGVFPGSRNLNRGKVPTQERGQSNCEGPRTAAGMQRLPESRRSGQHKGKRTRRKNLGQA